MATAASDKRTVELDVLERNWLRRCIENQQAMIRRNMAKEMPGSEIFRLRQGEIESLNQLVGKF